MGKYPWEVAGWENAFERIPDIFFIYYRNTRNRSGRGLKGRRESERTKGEYTRVETDKTIRLKEDGSRRRENGSRRREDGSRRREEGSTRLRDESSRSRQGSSSRSKGGQ